MLHISLYSNGKRSSQIPSKNHIDFFVFTWPGDFTGLWLYNENMLVFHFIHPHNVAIPVYTRLFCIDSAPKHLVGYTWGPNVCFWTARSITVYHSLINHRIHRRIHEIYFRTFNDFHLRLFVDSQFRVLFVPFSPHSLHMFPPFLSRGGSPGSAGLQHWFQGSRSCTRQRYGDGPRWGV